MSVIKCPLMDREVKGFKCANQSIEKQIEDSYFITLLKQAYGHKIIIGDKVIGYYMLHFKGIKLETINAIMGEEYSSSMLDYYMVLHIRYLAIDERLQHKGIGTRVLKAILSEVLDLSKKYPIRVITLDALKEYHKWYYNIGFKDIPGMNDDGFTVPMYISCMTEEDKKILNDFCGCY